MPNYQLLSLWQADGIKKERDTLQTALKTITGVSSSIVLGIKADSGTKALQALKAWVTHLELPRGKLMAVDESNEPVEVDTWNGTSLYHFETILWIVAYKSMSLNNVLKCRGKRVYKI